MKPQDILQTVNLRLKEVVALNYIDRNWGQLEQGNPAVKFPCALSDIDVIQYENTLNTAQTAECEVSVTVACLNFYNTSAKAPNKAKGYDVFDLLEAIHGVLHCFGTPELSPLTRQTLEKIETGKDYSVYRLTYKTAFVTQLQKSYNTVKPKFIIHNS